MSVHLEREINKLRKKLMQLAALVEESVRKSVVSVTNRSEELAKEVIANDDEIDRIEVELEEECLKILALHQPVAADLRYVIACLKINNDLERIGDLAVNIAERAVAIAESKEERVPVDFSNMMTQTQSMLTKAIDSIIESSSFIAKEVCEMDYQIDQMNRDMHEQIIKMIKDKPKKTRYFLHLLGVSRQLERVADYASNICEDVIYMVDGKIIRHSKSPAENIGKNE